MEMQCENNALLNDDDGIRKRHVDEILMLLHFDIMICFDILICFDDDDVFATSSNARYY